MKNIIINEKITEAIEVLKLLPKTSQLYWLDKMNNLCNSDKGFIVLYMGLLDVNE